MNQSHLGSNRYNNFELISDLQDDLCDDLPRLFEKLGVELYEQGKRFAGCCPIHGGDNPTAFNIYPDGVTMRGYWVCRSRHCEHKYKATPMGFIRGVLSANCGRECSWKEAVDFALKFLGYKHIGEVKVQDQLNMQKKKKGTFSTNSTYQSKKKGWDGQGKK